MFDNLIISLIVLLTVFRNDENVNILFKITRFQYDFGKVFSLTLINKKISYLYVKLKKN